MWPLAARRPLSDSSIMKRLSLFGALWAIVLTAEGLTINSCAYNEPQSPTVELNTNLTAFCILNQTCLQELDHPITSRELFWKVGNTVIPESQYTLVNESVSSVTFQPTLDMHNSLTCAFKAYGQTDVTLHGIYFTLGYPPAKPENLSCICYNIRTLTCTWDPGRPTIMPTTYTMKQYWLGPDLLNNTEIVQNLTSDYPKSQRPSGSRPSSERQDCVADPEKRSCTLAYPNFQLHIDTTFLVEAENPLGRVASERVEFDIAEIVKPDPPDVVTVSAVLERVLRIEWKNPMLFMDLKYNIRYRPNGGTVWSEVPADDLASTRDSFSLQELQPYTNYTISIRCKLTKARFWSDWSKEYTAGTSESAPSQGPEFWRKIIKTESDADERVVQLMWKDLKSQANGLILGYNVTVRRAGEVVRSFTVQETTCNVTLPADLCEVVLTAYNSRGPSPPSSLIIPPVPDDKVVQPLDMTLKAYPKDGRLWVEWKPLRKALAYVLEWCSNSLSMDCAVEWQREPSDASRTFLRGDIRPFVHYLIRLTALLGDGQERSAMVAAYLQQGAPTSGPSVQTKFTGKTRVTLTWTPVPLREQNGFITNYTIKFGDKVIPVNANETEYTLQSLSANTAYSVYMSANTAGGRTFGRPLSFNTMLFDNGELEAIVVSSCLGFMVLILVLCFLFCNKKEQIKKHIWPNVPDPSKSNIAQWSPQTPSRHGSKPNPYQEGPFTDVSVVKITADEKPYGDQDLKSEEQMKTATSEGLSSGIGGSSCLSSPQLSVSESDGISCTQSTSSTVQYSTVIMGGYQGQTPMFSRSESTQPLLISEERPDEQPPVSEEEAETPSQYFKQNFTREDGGRSQEPPAPTQEPDAQILQLAGFSDGHDASPDSRSPGGELDHEQKTYMPQSARQGGYLPQ